MHVKAPNRSTEENDNDDKSSDKKEHKNNKKAYYYYTQAVTFAASGIEHSVIQYCTAKRWVLRAFLNETFDCEFLMSYGSMLNIIYHRACI